MRVVVTGGAVILDDEGRVLLQRRSDYGDWGLPGGGMNPGESIEETMIREVFEETGLRAEAFELYAVYSGPRMEYTYPDGNMVVFVMFLFRVTAPYKQHLADDGITLLYQDPDNESLQLQFWDLGKLPPDAINKVQRPVFADLLMGKTDILRT